MSRILTVDQWLVLPELAMGTYRVHNLGWFEASLAECRKGGVPNVPTVEGDEGVLGLRLPTVEIILEAGPTMYRLPLVFGSIVKHMYEDAGRTHRAGQRFLPATYRFALAHDGSASVNPSDGSS